MADSSHRRPRSRPVASSGELDLEIERFEDPWRSRRWIPQPLPAAGAAPPTTCIEAESFALRVIDDSMEPEFAAGCIIIIDPTGVAKDGAFVLAEIEGEYIFRELRRTDGGDRLVALNDDYPSVALAAGLASVRGVVVQRAGARRRYHKRYD